MSRNKYNDNTKWLMAAQERVRLNAETAKETNNSKNAQKVSLLQVEQIINDTILPILREGFHWMNIEDVDLENYLNDINNDKK